MIIYQFACALNFGLSGDNLKKVLNNAIY